MENPRKGGNGGSRSTTRKERTLKKGRDVKGGTSTPPFFVATETLRKKQGSESRQDIA